MMVRMVASDIRRDADLHMMVRMVFKRTYEYDIHVGYIKVMIII